MRWQGSRPQLRKRPFLLWPARLTPLAPFPESAQVYGEIARRELNALGLSVKYDPVAIDASASSVWAGVKNRYWHFPVYFHPTCTMPPPAAPAGAPPAGTDDDAAPAAAPAGQQPAANAEAAAAPLPAA